MSYDPIPGPVEVEADPKRPWKAVGAFVVSFLGLLWVSIENEGGIDHVDSWQDWLTIIVPAVITTGTVYLIRNPKVAEIDTAPEDGSVSLLVVGAVLAVAGLLVVLLTLMDVLGWILLVVGVVLMVLAFARGERTLR